MALRNLSPSVTTNLERWAADSEGWRGYLVREGRLLLEQRVELCLELVTPCPGGRLLDIGCGDGRLTGLFAERAQAGTVMGADIGGRAAEVPTVRVNLDGPHALPFADASFDVVVCTETLEHVHDTDHLAAEVHRVLRPSGYAIFSVPRMDSLLAAGMLLLGYQPPALECSLRKRYGAPEAGTQVSGHVSHFTRRALLELLRAQGFAIERTAQASIYSSWLLSVLAQGAAPSPWKRLPLWLLAQIPFKRDCQIAKVRRAAA